MDTLLCQVIEVCSASAFTLDDGQESTGVSIGLSSKPVFLPWFWMMIDRGLG